MADADDPPADRPASHRRLFLLGYWALAIAVLVLGIGLRTRLPQTPLLDDDFWGYLHPALSKLTGGGFQHTYGRDFLYPGFVWLILGIFRDFRAVAGIQHALGLLTGVLMVWAWERLARLLNGGWPLTWKTRLLGLLAAATYVSGRSTQLTEHTVRPEAIYPFFVLLSIGLNLEFITRVWPRRETGNTVVWLGGAGIFLSVMLYELKPSTGFAVIFANLPVLWTLLRPGLTLRRKVTMAGGGAILALLLLLLPEKHFRRSDPMTSLFLPNTLLTIHADMIRDQIAEDLKSGKPLPYPRDWLTALRDRLDALIKTSAQPEHHPYKSLGFNPDYLLYHDYVFKDLKPHASEGGDDWSAKLSFYYYRRTALHHPGRMAGKIFRQLDTFYRVQYLSPDHLFGQRDPLRPDKETPLGPQYAASLACTQQSGFQEIVGKYPPAQRFVAETARLVDTPKKVSQRSTLSITQNLLTQFYSHILLACILGAGWMLAHARTRHQWLGPFGVLLLVYCYNLGSNLTVSIVHSLDVGRYTTNQFAFTLFSSASGILFLGLMIKQWLRNPAEPRTANVLPAVPLPIRPSFASGPAPSANAFPTLALSGPLPSLCVLIPCYNEAESVQTVVREYRAAFPDARILVVDNASTDGTAELAVAAGADVWRESRRGKASAVRSALAEIDQDLVLMVDGDGSYPAEGGHILLQSFLAQPADLITGIRSPEVSADGVFRPMHQHGTRLFGRVLHWVFGFDSADLFSGLRLFSRRFYHNVPIQSRGFELELELTVQAIDKGFSMRELPVPFGLRTAGTRSKLRTVPDGLRILRLLVVLARDYQPWNFFGAFGGVFFLLSLSAGFLPVWEFFKTRYITHVPLAILAASLMVLAFLCFHAGIILESSLRHQRENFQHRIRNSFKVGTADTRLP